MPTLVTWPPKTKTTGSTQIAPSQGAGIGKFFHEIFWCVVSKRAGPRPPVMYAGLMYIQVRATVVERPFFLSFFLSFFLGFRRPNLITGLSGWRTPDYPHRTQEPVSRHHSISTRRNKTSSGGQSEGLLIQRSSVRFQQKLKTSRTQIYMNLSYIDPQERVLNYCYK